MWKKSLIGIFLFNSILGTTFSQKVSDQTSIQTKHNYVDFVWANDITNRTDYYYSNGFELNYYNANLSKSPFEKIMLFNKINGNSNSGISFKHHIFTPIYQSDSIAYGDRPFSSYFVLSYHREQLHFRKKIRVASEAGFGIIGKYAFGRQVQNGFHNLLANSSLVEGWDNQINNSPLFFYHISVEKGIFEREHLLVNGIGKLRMGLPYTDAVFGGYVQMGLFDSYFHHTNRSHTKKFQIYLFGQAQIKFSAYNATLQGGINQQKNFYTIDKISGMIPEMEVGLGFQFKTANLKVGQHFIGKEFSTAVNHQWGYVSIGYCF